jgi:hypothetical protein
VPNRSPSQPSGKASRTMAWQRFSARMASRYQAAFAPIQDVRLPSAITGGGSATGRAAWWLRLYRFTYQFRHVLPHRHQRPVPSPRRT